jgi:hypothetical protein
MKRLILIVLATFALAACGSEHGTGDAGSGIEGTVAIGPTCPVQTAESPCEDAPYEATITVTSDGDVVATGESTADGTFRIVLPPGTYEVKAEPLAADAIAHADPLTQVVVDAGAFTHVGVLFDSGIR